MVIKKRARSNPGKPNINNNMDTFKIDAFQPEGFKKPKLKPQKGFTRKGMTYKSWGSKSPSGNGINNGI